MIIRLLFGSKAFTGLERAALIAWKLIVNSAIKNGYKAGNSEYPPADINTNAKSLSQLFIAHR